MVLRYSKSGKTAGASTAPGGVIYLNLDLPNATRFAHRRNPDGRIMEIEIPAREDGKTHLLALMGEIAQEIMRPQDVVESVVVDPIGELYRRLLEELSNRSISPTLQQHLATGVHIERFCRFLCESPINTVFVCHENPVKDEATGEFERLPYTGTSNPALGQKLLGMVDIVAYSGVVEKEDGTTSYMAQLISAKGRRGGDRFACLGSARALNIAEWTETIRASEGKVSAPRHDEEQEELLQKVA